MSQPDSLESETKREKRFDGFVKMVLLSEVFEVLAFFLLQKGYILIGYERLPNELQTANGTLYIVDALFKAIVKCPDGSINEACIDIEFQHSNDPDMAERLYDYRRAIKQIHQVKMVIPLVVYTGEYRCTMVLKDDDEHLEIVRTDFPLVDITQLESEIFTAHSSYAVHFLAILNHRFEPAVLARLLYDDLQRIKHTKGVAEMNRWFNFLLSVTTSKNKRAMATLKELMQIHPELIIDNQEGLKILFEEEYLMKRERDEEELAKKEAQIKSEGIEIGKSEGIEIGKSEGIEIGKSEGIEIGKSEGKVEGRIESAYLMMKNGGISFDGVSAILGLSEMEQEMLRRRMSQNGH